jgi:beta-phosphoglucomutase-like phosphatase (HAD superfamily)
LGQPVGVRATGQTRPARTFWWDREPPVEADILRAVIFDADSALADIERDGHRVAFNAAFHGVDGDISPRTGLIDLVMSLFCAGIWVGVVSTRRREPVETLVRQLVGDGLVETIVTVDDLPEIDAGPTRDAELYRLALWELGITPQGALAIAGSRRGLRAAVAAKLPAAVVTTGYTAAEQFVGAAEIRAGYDGPDPLLAADCQQAHRRWWIAQQRSRAA